MDAATKLIGSRDHQLPILIHRARSMIAAYERYTKEFKTDGDSNITKETAINEINLEKTIREVLSSFTI